MTPHTVYEEATGRITSYHYGGPYIQVVPEPGQAVVNQMCDFRFDYVLDGEVTKRPVMPLMVDQLTVTGFPAGSSVTVEDATYELGQETSVTFSFDYPGSYLVRFCCWPYLDSEVELSNGD
ncbi:MAG: hypothetical protein H5U32_02695 [Pseudomonas balearica]|uniref:hypothetical protein n=1 Tax=Stutzerimonas balearica TaxID=74829 RepID=UPI0019A30572|nr:hypothetical protein [Stutzerimonas balearica]MBC7198137.1 hypothetical protein [Stutzerimonas balearica]